MIKKLCFVLLLTTFIFTSVFSSFANTGTLDSDIIYSAETKSTKDEFLVNITRPDGNESTFKKSYVLCGVSENDKFDNLVVKLLIYDEESESYKDYKNADGESSWNLGKYGIFIKEIVLPHKDENKIRLAVYKESDEKDLILGKNLQVSNFTITVLDEDIKEKIKNGISKITDLLKNFFSIK